MLHDSSGVSRRVFLGAAAGLATVIHRPLFAQPAAPSDQIQLALIGVGGMGTGRLKEFMTHPDVRIAAICDVDGRHRDAAIALVQSTLGYAPPGEGDFRRLLTNKDIDAVAIQTPDHWHAITAVRAMEAGKDVFVEKPLSYSMAEGRAMADASTRHARVTQMGNHIHNTGRNYRDAVEIVQSGSTRAKFIAPSAGGPGTPSLPTTSPQPSQPNSITTSGSARLRNGPIIPCGRT